MFPFEFVRGGDEVHGYFFIVGLTADNGFEQLHQVARLVEEANVRIGEDNAMRSLQIGTKERSVRHTTLVLLKDQVLFGRCDADRCVCSQPD